MSTITASRRVAIATFTSRTALRAHRPIARHAFLRRTYAAEASQQSSNHTTAGVIGGLAGGFLVFGGGYLYYHFSGMKTAMNFLHKGRSYLSSASKSVQDSAPEPNEALDWLRSVIQSYAGFIPGAKGYVNTAFDDIDKIRAKHGGEVDEIVSDSYHKLKDLTKSKGVTLDTAGDAMTILTETMSKILGLAGDAAEDILNNHPKLKQQLGGNIDQLKQMGDQYGPEAKKQVDETWQKIASIVSGGIGVSTIPQIKKLVQEKSEQLKQMGNAAFDKGLEQAKPYLDKVPQAKQIIEENKEALKQSDMGTLWKKVQEAASSGSTGDLESFIKDTTDQVKQKAQGGSGGGGGGMSSMLSMIPNGNEIFEKISKLSDISKKHGKEAEDLLHSTMKEIQDVLQKKVQDAEQLASKGAEEAKKQ